MRLRDLERQMKKPEETPTDEDPGYYLIESKVLDGEIVVFALEKKLLKKLRAEFPGLVIYFPPEIDEIYKYRDNKEFIKKVHLVKKKFRGWIVPSANRKGVVKE